MEYDNLIGTELEMFTAADVDPKEINWLWYPYIPFGKVTVLAGDSGDGKSTFALNLAALFTRGGTLPFTEASIEPMNVIYLNSEDAADDTVVPRFMKANGVRDRLFFISEEKQKLNFADRRIRQAIEEKGARVIILDPLVSYLGHDVSMNLGNEVRPRTEYLIEAARETGCAIIIVAHINKAEGMSAKNRTSGSSDIIAAARSALLIARPLNGDDPDHRVMAHSKSNLARLGESVLFSVCDGVVDFIDTIDVTADQLVKAVGTTTPRETKQAVASRELLSMLSDGPKYQKEIMERMSELGISQRTCELAKAKLDIQTMRGEINSSVWMLDDGRGNHATMQGYIPFAEQPGMLCVATGSPEGTSGPRTFSKGVVGYTAWDADRL